MSETLVPMARQRKSGGKPVRGHAGSLSARSSLTSIRRLATLGVILLAFAAGAAWWFDSRTVNKPQSVPSASLPTLPQLLALTPRQREDVDIALVNLRCAEGLAGSETLDIPATLKRLDEIAERVDTETIRHLHRFREKPSEYQHSEAYFRLLMLAVVAQEDFGIRYNPERVTAPGVFQPNDAFFSNAKDVFLHGLTIPPMMGTCSSMPVFYVAVGRRLGYPLSLVSTKNHLFVRWEDSRTRLNVEATAQGLETNEDEHYRSWPYRVTDDEIEANGYLKSMSPEEELSSFVAMRAACLMSGRRYQQAVQEYRQAAALAPHLRGLQKAARLFEAEAAQRFAALRMRQIDQINRLLDREDVPPSAVRNQTR